LISDDRKQQDEVRARTLALPPQLLDFLEVEMTQKLEAALKCYPSRRTPTIAEFNLFREALCIADKAKREADKAKREADKAGTGIEINIRNKYIMARAILDSHLDAGRHRNIVPPLPLYGALSVVDATTTKRSKPAAPIDISTRKRSIPARKSVETIQYVMESSTDVLNVFRECEEMFLERVAPIDNWVKAVLGDARIAQDNHNAAVQGGNPPPVDGQNIYRMSYILHYFKHSGALADFKYPLEDAIVNVVSEIFPGDLEEKGIKMLPKNRKVADALVKCGLVTCDPEKAYEIYKGAIESCVRAHRHEKQMQKENDRIP